MNDRSSRLSGRNSCHFQSPVLALFSPIISDRPLPSLGYSLQPCVVTAYSDAFCWRQSSPCAPLSPCPSCGLQLPWFTLHLSSSPHPGEPAGPCLRPTPQPENSLKAVILENRRAPLFISCLWGIIILYRLISSTFETHTHTHAHTLFQFLYIYWFRQDHRASPCYSILAESLSPSHFWFLLRGNCCNQRVIIK